MNKIIIVYDNYKFPLIYTWNISIISDIDDIIDFLVNDRNIQDFDIIETVLDTETFRKLWILKNI